jgi:hypothetical protein
MFRRCLTAFALLVCGACAADLAPSDLRVELLPASAARPARVQVTGLSSDELRDLRNAAWDAAAWRQLLLVSVEDTPDVAIAGEYIPGDSALEFQPVFPFDPGRTYRVQIDPSRLPRPRQAPRLDTTAALPPADPGPAVEVTHIYPSAEVWPENLLRFYIHFSGPMARQPGVEHVRLFDERGREVRDALLESPVDFWSPDQRRYTVFFDPGRVKSDLVPNRQLGRALLKGRRYTIEVGVGWKDAAGRPLREAYRRTFLAGPAVDRALDLGDWQLSLPAAGTRDALVVTVPWSLDRALLERTVGVARGDVALDGRVHVVANETQWRFEPAEVWSADAYDLLVLSVLEDPQGNLIGQPFEVDPHTAAGAPPRPERYAIPFTPR